MTAIRTIVCLWVLSAAAGCFPMHRRTELPEDRKAPPVRSSGEAPAVPGPTRPRTDGDTDATALVSSRGPEADGPGRRSNLPSARPDADDFTVAEVNGEYIHFVTVCDLIAEELRTRRTEMPAAEWEAFARRRLLDELDREIERRLVFYDAWKALKPQEQEQALNIVQQRLDAEAEQARGRGRWLDRLAAAGLTEEQLRRRYTLAFMVMRAMRQKRERISVRPDEVRAEYDRVKDKFPVPARIRFRMLEIDRTGRTPKAIDGKEKATPAEVRDFVVAKLKAGGDFVELAKKYSDYRPGEGGLWYDGGNPTADNLPRVESWVAALHKLKPGECTPEPLDSPDGNSWCFFHLEERREAGFKPLSEVYEYVEQQLESAKLSAAWREYVDGLRRKAYVQKPDGLEESVSAALRRRFPLTAK